MFGKQKDDLTEDDLIDCMATSYIGGKQQKLELNEIKHFLDQVFVVNTIDGSIHCFLLACYLGFAIASILRKQRVSGF